MRKKINLTQLSNNDLVQIRGGDDTPPQPMILCVGDAPMRN